MEEENSALITQVVQQHVGKRLVRKGQSAGTSDNSVRQEELEQVAGVRRVRVISPGMMVTMDYSPTRLNVDVDDNDIITSFSMG